MPFYNGEKWACYSCTKGHRSSKCAHLDRILYKVRKPGRPLNNCPHILPETIQPGTFVNTSSESMANGSPPKEACNCKNELVQVAIPKVKSCSCIPSVPPGTVKPPQAPVHGDTGVKSGRVMKKQQVHRRKKSIVHDDLFEAAKTEPGGEEAIADAKAQTPNREFDVSLLPVGSGDPDSFSANGSHAHPIVTMGHMRHHQISSGSLQSPWPVDSNTATSAEQASPANHAQSLHPQPKLNLHSSILQIGTDQQSLAYSPHAQTPRNSVYPLTSLSPMEGSAFFNGFDKLPIPNEPIVRTSFQEHGNTTTVPSQECIMVPLTHHEYLWIQHARASGVNFTQLPKFVPETDPQIPSSIPFAKLHSSSPAASTPVFTTPPARPVAGGCCAGRVAPHPAPDSAPSSPRCKCGEACRCVPCADHPFNPAMLETIKGGMQLIQEQKPSPRGGSGFEDIETGDVTADFRDFVFYNYPYSGCSEGQGSCMCGEGCTCVGCLTHGGHDGVELSAEGV